MINIIKTMATNTAPFGGNSMNRRLIHTLLIGVCAVAPLVAAPAHAAANRTAKPRVAAAQSAPVRAAPAPSGLRPGNDLLLSVGRGQLVTIGGTITDIFVANEGIADVEVKSSRQLYVFGRAGGETTIYASNANGDIIWSANVRVGSNIESVDQMLKLAMPDAKVGVATMGTGTYLLTGTVASPEDAAEAERLVKAFVSGGKGAEVNVVSRLRTATPLQVNLQVRIAEVSRSLVKTIGFNFNTADRTSGFKFGLAQGRNFSNQYTPGGPLAVGNYTGGGSIIQPLEGSNTLGFATKFLGLDLLGALDAGETVGLVSTLAQPNLTALSGETADFLAGGEFPIPLSQGLGTTSIEFKRFGVSLSYTPTVLSNGRISLRVRPEVSELSSEGAINLGSFTIPALTVRRTETTVELGSGQSFMIAGLMRNNAQNTIKKIPGAGDVPILGSLFRSTSFQKGETELVIVVTPYLVNPVDAKDIKLPTDGYNTPNELQRLLGNMSSDGKTGQQRPGPTAAPDKNAPPAGAAAPAKSGQREAAAPLPQPGFNLK